MSKLEHKTSLKEAKSPIFHDSFLSDLTKPEFWFQHINPFGKFYKESEVKSQPQESVQQSNAIEIPYNIDQGNSRELNGNKLIGFKQKDLDAFNEMYDELGETQFRTFLTKIAGLESRWQNNPKGNSTHAGLYQIKDTYLEYYTGVKGITREQYVKDPKLQTKAAISLAKENYKQISEDQALLSAAAKRGYGIWELMAGAWLAGYSGMRRQFFTGKHVGDINGTTIIDRMNAYKNMTV